MKTCTTCKQIKELTEFHPQKTGKYGVGSRCKTCTQAYKKVYNVQHKEQLTVRAKEWNKRNKDKVRIHTLRYYKKLIAEYESTTGHIL